jgi:hypothetical protein
MIRILKKFISFGAVGISGVLVITLIACQVEQQIYRSRAELLFSEIQSLESGKTPWLEAKRKLDHWARISNVSNKCDSSECSVQITLVEPVYGFLSRSLVFVHLDDDLRWLLRLSYDQGPFVRIVSTLSKGYMAIGGRPAKTTAAVGMRDGFVTSIAFWVNIETYWHDIPKADSKRWFEYTLIGGIQSIPRLDYGKTLDGEQFTRHPKYLISRPGGCEGCVEGYINFTADADPADIRRLMKFDLSCLTRIRPCLDQSDIMPVAWAQYQQEHPQE